MGTAPIRDAATVIVVRDRTTRPRLLFGQRGRAAVFMPDKFVFPGGAVDPGDDCVELARPLSSTCHARLDRPGEPKPNTLAAAAIRELWEETGQIAGCPSDWSDAPTDWRAFAATGHRPDASGLIYVFRAITPAHRPRRFDARFFLLDADRLAGDPDDFSSASDELGHLGWVPLDQARALDLPFITSVVLAEVAALGSQMRSPDRIPYFRNDACDFRVADAAAS